MNMKEEIEKRIQNAFPGCQVVVLDERGDGYHFDVRVAAREFGEMSRVQRHQAIMSLFRSELDSGQLHAMTIKTLP